MTTKENELLTDEELGKRLHVFYHSRPYRAPEEPYWSAVEVAAKRLQERRASAPAREDERGFTAGDYEHTARLMTSSEDIRRATVSNNHNIILAALFRCAGIRLGEEPTGYSADPEIPAFLRANPRPQENKE